jgi:uncharacterized protein DUF1573
VKVALSFRAVFICVLSALPALAGGEAPRAVFQETRFDFGRAMYGSVVEHDFWVKNEGSAALKIVKASMTSPLLVTRMPRELAPGGEGVIHFKLDTAALRGPFKGQITVFLNDPDLPEADLSFEGVVIPPVEVSPLPAFFVASLRGKETSASLEIINHEPQPLHIVKIEHPTDGFTTVLETLQSGQRYKLTLILRPDGPGGRNTEPITVATSSAAEPALEITANTFLHERVYTFPDSVDLGAIPISQIRKNPGLLSMLAQTLMVYQEDGSDFRATLHTDLPMLNLKWDRGPKGDRYQATISLDPNKVKVGSYDGFLLIDTNDAEIPRVKVPVSGQILER